MTEEKKAKTNKPTAKRKQGKADNAATPEVQKPAPLSELEQRARKWGAAYARVCDAVCDALLNLALRKTDELLDADKALAAEEQAKLRRYCEKRMAALDAELKKAIAEGRAHELVKYYPKTGRCVWRKAKA